MKQNWILGLICLLLGSCNEDQITENVTGGEIIDVRLKIILVDELLQDKLNPESPAYIGESYVNEIEILYLDNGKKLTLLQLWPSLTQGNAIFPEDFKAVRPPYRETERYGSISENTFGYYYVDTSPLPILAVNDIMYIYIKYAEGNQDEIKVQLFRNKEDTVTLMRNIWINGELVYALSENMVLFYQKMLPDSIDGTNPDDFKDYYNPKYYPWLEPLLDNDGNQMGTCVRPKGGSDAIVIMK